ncbi:GNAT family N-acetyltransferase [Jeotgalibacillus aurantiacus]|uniref:GNAT family N-acetyltransferase n=1 Tax=Jeotgalibacillus aurantiacus TaxID=2763266 RepID=UPI001D0AB6A4|nr:GNAT family protein [Jeotgalibacillus aurantiacus]
MEPFFTERLVMRPYTLNDYEEYIRQMERRKHSQHQYDEGYIDMKGFTKEMFQEKLDRFQRWAEDDHVYVWALFKKENGELIGHTDLMVLSRGDTQWGVTGYALHNQFWGEGFGTEALKGLTNIAFEKLKLHRLEAQINLDNEASIKTAKRAGFEYECVRKNFLFENGCWTDHVIYVKTKTETSAV